LIREGTTQEERFSVALDPASAPVDERGIEQGIAYARAYAKVLRYYDADNNKAGDWQPFFSKDVSALLAVMAIQDVEEYRANIKKYLDTLENEKKQKIVIKEIDKEDLGKLFSCIGMLARQLDILKEGLPKEYPLKGILHNVITNRLSAELKNLICCHRQLFDDKFCPLQNVVPSFKVIQSEANIGFVDLLEQYEFSTDWVAKEQSESKAGDAQKEEEQSWRAYLKELYDPKKLKCPGQSDLGSFYNEIKSISNNFLKVYARTVSEARQAFGKSLKWDRHEPHYTLFLAFLRLLEHARNEMNTLTGKHLDFYYRDILRFKEKEIVPPKAHVLVELAKKVPSHLIEKGELFKAGKDESGKDVFFASERDFVANRAQVAELKTVFRYQPDEQEINDFKENQGEEIEVSEQDAGRIYASSIANSADGQGAELISEDKSWHPFFNKKYEGGELSKIEMPKAEVGFAIASHYLWMAGGTRTITITFLEVQGANLKGGKISYQDDIICYITGEKDWIKTEVKEFKVNIEEKTVILKIEISGEEPAIVPYSSKTHKYDFQTHLPILRLELAHQNTEKYSYDSLENIKFNKINLTVDVKELKELAVSNDFGPVDTSKPFQPFGASPVKNSTLIIGSKEAFQKKLIDLTIRVRWQDVLTPYDNINIIAYPEILTGGIWSQVNNGICISKKKALQCFFVLCNKRKDNQCNYADQCNYSVNILNIPPDTPELSEQEYYNNFSRYGFVRLRLKDSFGQKKYEQDILNCVKNHSEVPKEILDCIKALPDIPVPPVITELTINYETESQEIIINSAEDTKPEQASFFHIAPFGYAEQYLPKENSKKQQTDALDKNINLLPHIAFPLENTIEKKNTDGVNNAEAAEFYIGITDLKPPQNLSLLFQAADGTANPRKIKPKQHIQWGFLRKNEWVDFSPNTVEDNTDGLITSGIITFAVPRDASDDNTLLPAGMHWIRAAVSSNPDAVCRLRMVAAQALKVTFTDKGNDPVFSAKVLPKSTISKLAQPAAAVKKIIQPFPSYGGRGKEESKAFYTRVSERLRHKDRAVTLWDYERLILEAFPEVHKVKCLNHYDPKKEDEEPAPGHVTLVTVADREHHSLPDPLRPNISLGLRKKIKDFLKDRLSTFVKLHIVNPTFEKVKVDFEVKLRPGFDETYSIYLLRQNLVRFLSPWAFTGGGSPSFGGKIYRSALINFVEEQDYVDYVINFKLMHLVGACKHADQQDHEEVEGKDAISILVSVPASDHIINTIPAS